MIGRLSVSLVTILFLVTSGLGQQGVYQQTNWNDRIQQLSFMNRADSEYKLGTGDLIEVSVFGVKDYNYDLRVNSRGQVTLPLLGLVQAADLSPSELEQELKTRFENGYIKNAQISVFVKEYRSQPVFVLGAVRQPGQYQMIHQLNLVDVISMAGGLVMEKAADHALVQRRGSTLTAGGSVAGPDVTKVDLNALLQEGDLGLNVPIQGGDVIHVPERKVDFYYVVGEIIKPGGYEIPARNEVLVSQALASAGGPLSTAKISKGILVRYDGTGFRQELAINFERIIKGEEEDFTVVANDILFIPGSGAKKLAQGLMQIIPHTVSGSIIWGAIR